MNHLKRYLYVALGGGIGALSRYLLLDFSRNEIGIFSFSTILVNLIGAFLLTFLLNLTIFNSKVNKELQLAIKVGIIGAFTTFSLIMIDLIKFIVTPSLFITYYLVTIFGGILVSYIAYLFARYLNKRGELK